MAHKWEDTAFKGSIARARGLGSAHAGLHHWMGQKITAIANIPLVLWGIWSVASLSAAGADLLTVQGFFHQPMNAVLMILFLASVFYHMVLGLQVAIEDYFHSAAKPLLLIAIKLLGAGLFVAAAFSVLKLAL